jgi:hypothetical protein
MGTDIHVLTYSRPCAEHMYRTYLRLHMQYTLLHLVIQCTRSGMHPEIKAAEGRLIGTYMQRPHQ